MVDKVPSKFAGWSSNRFRDAVSRRAGAIVRRSAYIAPNVVLMPSFVNVGAIRQRHNGRHLGDGRLMRPDRQELPPFRRGRIAASWSHCRPSGDHRG